jgi:hypothetical protein
MDYGKFIKIREMYGDCASWATWQTSDQAPKAGIADLSIFDPTNRNNVISTLKTDVILVGLNISRADIGESWGNFHSANPRGTDYKLRHALLGTPLWGCYLTDILKDYEEVKSSSVEKDLRSNPNLEKLHTKNFKVEVDFVCDAAPVIFSLGNAADTILRRNFSNYYRIHKLRHYAQTSLSLEQYKIECEQIISDALKFKPEKK